MRGATRPISAILLDPPAQAAGRCGSPATIHPDATARIPGSDSLTEYCRQIMVHLCSEGFLIAMNCRLLLPGNSRIAIVGLRLAAEIPSWRSIFRNLRAPAC
jgi:hypothetical protein